MHINKLCIITQRGNLLNGAHFEDGPSDTALIVVTGLHGNSFTNPFLRDMGRRIAKAGIHFILAESADAHPRIESYNVRTQQVEQLGSGTARLADCIDDIGSYVSKACAMGYKHIYLGGHCLGASKVVHYLATTQDPRVERFVLLNPGDHGLFMAEVTPEEKTAILEKIAQGLVDEPLPFALMGWFRCTVGVGYDYVSDDCIIYNVSAETDPPRDDLRHIIHHGMLVIGEQDVYPANGPLDYIEKINAKIPDSKNNELIEVPGADHVFTGCGEILADSILPVLQRWGEEDSHE